MLNKLLIRLGYKNQRGQTDWSEIRFDAMIMSLITAIIAGILYLGGMFN